jgi:hypothetical protein
MLRVEIRIRGHLDKSWADWLHALTIEHTASGESVIAGGIEDEAALYGLITRLRDLGLTLVAVKSWASGEESP